MYIYLRRVVVRDVNDECLCLAHPAVKKKVVGSLKISDEGPPRYEEHLQG